MSAHAIPGRTAADLRRTLGQNFPGGALIACLALSASAQAQVFSKTFLPATIAPGSVSTLEFTIDNSDSGTSVTDVAFTDTLPAAVTIATPASPLSTCGGTVDAPDGGTTITLSGGTLGASSTCSVAVNTTSSTPGTHTNVSGDLTSSAGNSGTASADLTVEPPPIFSKSFNPASINIGGVSTLRFTIDNSASAVAASNLAFTDNLPAAVTVANPPNASTTCSGGTITAVAGTGVVSYGGGSVAAGATCTVRVDVTSSTTGAHVNTSGDLTSSSGASGTASDTLTVRSAGPVFSKAFVPAAIAAGDISTLIFTMDHSTGTNAATSLAFTDTLPAGVTIVNPPVPFSTCGGTITAADGTGTITFSGGSLTSRETCIVQVVVTGTTPGTYVNTSGPLNSSLGTSGTAVATLTVEAPPIFSKAFAPPSIGPGGITTLIFTIDNTGSSLPASGLAFTDTLPVAIVIANPPNEATTCTGGTITAGAGTGVVGYAGGSVAAGALCNVQVDVTSTTPGAHVNTTDDLVSSLGSSPPATATLTVGAAPSPLEIPAADRWALVALAVVLLGVAVLRLRLAS